jgi:hypothetical protein
LLRGSSGSGLMSLGRDMAKRSTGWHREFDDPIALPDGRTLITLRDAASCITALPKKEAGAPEWQAAIEALMLVVELGGPTMFARIGAMQALNRHHVRQFNPSRKEHHWGRRITGGGESSRGTDEPLLAHNDTRPNPLCCCWRHFDGNDTARLAGLEHDSLDLRRHQQAGWRPRSPEGICAEVAAEIWFKENDPEGVAFEYEVLE